MSRTTRNGPPPGPRRSRTLFRSLSLLGVAAIGALAGAGSCAAPFDSAGLVSSLRILSVDINRPDTSTDDEGDFIGGSFARAGDTVTFTMNIFDGRDTGGDFVPLQILWLGGCFNPPGNQYYGCYEQLGELFQSISPDNLPPEVGFGPVFDLTLPADIVTNVPEPSTGARVGTAYVFFMACAGQIGPVDQDGDTAAGSFPVGCFDADGRQLGPEAFVPGYTQVYAFEDERENQNPKVAGLKWDDTTLAADETPTAPACDVSVEDRKQMGCAATDEFTECTTIELDIDVSADVAEVDPGALDAEGNELREVVWVSYFATAGDFESETKLVSDAKKGLQGDARKTKWVPPPDPGLYEIWAVTRDNRGGSTTIHHTVTVE